jgi:hypothetical protein
MNYQKKVRCIRSVSSSYTVGKIYNVNEDGYVIDNGGYGITHLNLTTKFNCDGETFLGNSDFEEVKEETEEANMETQKLSRQGLKEIHSVACTRWKSALEHYGTRNPLEDYIELTQQEAQTMFNECTKDQLPIVSKYLKQDDGFLDFSEVSGSYFKFKGKELIAIRTHGELQYKSFILNYGYNWEIKKDGCGQLCLIPTKEK